MWCILYVVIFWNVAQCSHFVSRRFEGLYYFHLQYRDTAVQETNVLQKLCLSTFCMLVSCSAEFRPWRGRWYVPPKRRFSQNMTSFITTALITSNLTCFIISKSKTKIIPFKSHSLRIFWIQDCTELSKCSLTNSILFDIDGIYLPLRTKIQIE
jgi:hypothetical protein